MYEPCCAIDWITPGVAADEDEERGCVSLFD